MLTATIREHRDAARLAAGLSPEGKTTLLAGLSAIGMDVVVFDEDTMHSHAESSLCVCTDGLEATRDVADCCVLASWSVRCSQGCCYSVTGERPTVCDRCGSGVVVWKDA